MLTIGEFAQVTGLTIKALRHYDERGLLVPAEIDPVSRRRRYSGGQLHDAVLVKALRSAGMPVEAVRQALQQDPAGALEHFRNEVAAARAAQDRALAAASRLLTGFDGEVTFSECEVAATHVAAIVQRLPTDEQEMQTAATVAEEEATHAYYELFSVLEQAGCRPDGPGWTQFDSVDDDPDRVEVSLCWPLPDPAPRLPGQLDGVTVRSGVRPAGRELIARMDCGEDAQAPEGLPHPALVALMAELARREAHGVVRDIGSVRQFVAPDRNGRIIVELAVPLI